jgi:putative ABC transport system permease protein
MLQDLRYAVRMLAMTPGATAVIVLALALGIGANSAIFSVVDAILWQPMPFPGLDRLVLVRETDTREPDPDGETMAPANFYDLRRDSRTLENLAAYEQRSLNLSSTGEPERVRGFAVHAAMFRALGVPALIGRTFEDSEEETGQDRVAVLGHGLWRRRFAADPRVVGQTIRLDGREHTVIGVMPDDFMFPQGAELWAPLALTKEQQAQRGAHYLQAVARLKPGVTPQEAHAEMRTIAARLERAYPQSNKNVGAMAAPLRELFNSYYTRQYTRLLLAAVFFVLLIACANVANLQLALAAARQKEIAVRAAMGAGRWRVMRMLLAESLLRAGLGAVLGLLLALWGIDLLKSYMPPDIAIYVANWYHISLDWRTLGFAIAITTFAGLVSGLAPALQLSRPDLNETLKESGRSATASRSHHRLRSVLVVAEVSLALVLMVGAALMTQSVATMMAVSHTLRPETLLTFQIHLPESKYFKPPDLVGFHEQALTKLKALPGAQSVAVVTDLPYSQARWSSSFEIEGRPATAPGEYRIAQQQSVSPNFFSTLHVRLLDGRLLDERDGPEATKVAVISQALAQRYFAGENPLGKRVKLGGPQSTGPWWEIVGVVENLRHNSSDRVVRGQMYRPLAQAPTRRAGYAIRAAAPPEQLMAAARESIYSLDRDQPLSAMKTLARLAYEERIGFAYVGSIMAVLGVIALVLASVGVYGLMANSVAERVHEIGVRLALGAGRGNIFAMVLRRGMTLTAIGLAIGGAGAYALAQLLSDLIFGVRADDAVTFTVIPLFLAVVALAACATPARRATRVDPMVALRYE